MSLRGLATAWDPKAREPASANRLVYTFFLPRFWCSRSLPPAGRVRSIGDARHGKKPRYRRLLYSYTFFPRRALAAWLRATNKNIAVNNYLSRAECLGACAWNVSWPCATISRGIATYIWTRSSRARIAFLRKSGTARCARMPSDFYSVVCVLLRERRTCFFNDFSPNSHPI